MAAFDEPNETTPSSRRNGRLIVFLTTNWHWLLVESVFAAGSLSLAWIAIREITTSGLTANGCTPMIVALVLAAVGVLYGVANPPCTQTSLEMLFASCPGVLEVHPNGRVVLAGHRVSLFAIMESLEELGDSPHAIRELGFRYPTINAEQMAEVVNFLRIHEKLLRAYHACENRIARQTIQRLEKASGQPTLEELRRRRKERFPSA